LSRRRQDEYLEWIRMARLAMENKDYERAAHLYKYVTVHFGLLNDMENMRKFSVKAGECYFNAGRNLQDKDPLKAIQFYIKASKCFREGGEKERADECDALIENLYEFILRDGRIDSCGDAYSLKNFGDYFVSRSIEKATECYRRAAEKALKDRKLHLSGRLYGILGECYSKLNRYEAAAESYAKSASLCYECQEFFESAWRYCLSGFHFILAGRVDLASAMASRAESICREDRINVILNSLAAVCRLLSQGSLHEAKSLWNRFRWKFKRNYAEIIDLCFQRLNSKTK